MNAATLFALLALSPAHAPAPDSARPAVTCAAEVVNAFDVLDNALRHLEEGVEGVKKNSTKQLLREDLRAAILQSVQARRVACRASRDRAEIIVVQPAPPPVVVVVVDERHHRELVTVVRREAFDDGRLGALGLGVRDVCLTSSQARDFVQELTFSQARLDAVRVLAPRIVDRERSHLLLEALTFDSDKRTARELLMVTPTAPQCLVRRL